MRATVCTCVADSCACDGGAEIGFVWASQIYAHMQQDGVGLGGVSVTWISSHIMPI